METRRREFLQQISGVTALAASGSLLGRNIRAGSSQDESSAETQTIGYLESLRAQFPVLAERVNGNPLVYLDSAATTQRPRAVIDALSNFYLHDNANPAKTFHSLARRTATLYDKARETVARFVHARASQEIVWTRGTTEAINLVASSWGGANLHSGDEIILTVSEH
jgi:cysteine desulfurase / selenocysteine lyase